MEAVKKRRIRPERTPRSQFQLAGFRNEYKILFRQYDDYLTAFAGAIALTSDEATDRKLEKNPNAINEWLAMRGKHQIHRMYVKNSYKF